MSNEQFIKQKYPDIFIIKFNSTYNIYLSPQHFKRGKCLIRGVKNKPSGWKSAREKLKI